MSLLRNSATIGSLTLVSRVLGLVRDQLSARYLGAGLASDAFQVAWRLPNMFRALFAEGAFASVFVPMFNRTMREAEERSEDGVQAAAAFASDVLSVLLPFLIIFTLALVVLASPVVWLITGGFPGASPDKITLAIALSRITFPYLAFISLVSLLGGILNSLNRFWVNAAAPVLLNICMIVALLFFRGSDEISTVYTQAWAVSVSGAVQLLWLMVSTRAAGVSLRFRLPRFSPAVKKMLLLILPAAVGAGAVQFNQLITTALAAHFLPQGTISYLYYADRLNQLPLGLIGIGIGTAILPALSREIKGGAQETAYELQNRAIELAMMLAMPAAIALVLSAQPIVQGIFQWGRFSAQDTQECAKALAAFSYGVPAYVLIKVLTPGFYARQDTRTPLRIALISMGVNLIGNLALINSLGIIGITLSTAVAAWVNVALLYITLKRRRHLRVDTYLRRSLVQILMASVMMGVCLYFLNPIVQAHLNTGLLLRMFWLAMLVGGGAMAYAATGLVLGFVSYAVQDAE
jgi:putative peptidoglycan lipid II flippase